MKLKQAAKNFAAIAAASLLVGPSGVSNIRGRAGLEEFARLKDNIYFATSTDRMDMDCMASSRAEKRLELVICKAGAEKFNKGVKSLVGCQKIRGCIDIMSSQVDSDLLVHLDSSANESGEAGKFSYWATLDLYSSIMECGTWKSKADLWMTAALMIAPVRQSNLGAMAAVAGRSAERSFDAIFDECEIKK